MQIEAPTYQIIAVKAGLKAVQKGFRLNRAYTPKNLKAMTEKITGKKFKARDYQGMIDALQENLDAR